MPTSAHCHKKVAKVAKECCAATYDELMSSSNLVFAAWKRKHPAIADNPARLRQAFVNAKWGMFIDAARTTMACLLRGPTNSEVDARMKDEIVEILALDSTLIRGRVNPVQVAGQIVTKN